MTAQLDQIKNFLNELDSQLSFKDPYPLYLIGGAAITLAFDPQNRTADLDLIDPPEAIIKEGGIDSALAKKYRVYISPLAEINFSVPTDWRYQCKPAALNLKNLEILIPSLEDIVLGKIARLEPRDFEDILALHEKNLLDPKKLLKRLEENKKELKEMSYRHNAKLFFQEIFRLKLGFQKGRVKII